ncbi:hypothetical protein chiPu_0027891, partial [Chiloscyllium punctatum]|nr:hypothetical protein [Chiloscyllium punctatum]
MVGSSEPNRNPRRHPCISMNRLAIIPGVPVISSIYRPSLPSQKCKGRVSILTRPFLSGGRESQVWRGMGLYPWGGGVLVDEQPRDRQDRK